MVSLCSFSGPFGFAQSRDGLSVVDYGFTVRGRVGNGKVQFSAKCFDVVVTFVELESFNGFGGVVVACRSGVSD